MSRLSVRSSADLDLPECYDGGVPKTYFHADCCAVAPTAATFNWAMRFLGVNKQLTSDPTMLDLSCLLSAMSAVDFRTKQSIAEFTEDNNIPARLTPFMSVEQTRSRVRFAWQTAVGLFSALHEGRHRQITAFSFLLQRAPTATIPMQDIQDSTFNTVPRHSPLFEKIPFDIVALPSGGALDMQFCALLKRMSSNILKASQTTIRPAFRNSLQAILDCVKDIHAATGLLNMQEFLQSPHGTKSSPDAYVSLRRRLVKRLRPILLHDTFLEHAIQAYCGRQNVTKEELSSGFTGRPPDASGSSFLDVA